jgi:anti-sigma-K factor RskA
MTEHDAHIDAAAHALGALDAADAKAFEAHLATCVTCQQDVAAYQRVAAAIGESIDPEPPPDRLKAKVLAAATAEAQSRATPSIVRFPSAQSPPPSAPRRWTAFALAASVLLVAGLSAYVVFLQATIRELSLAAGEASARANALSAELAAARRDSTRLLNTIDVISAPDVIRVDLRGLNEMPAASGRAFMSAQGIILRAERLAPLPSGRVYQLWTIAAGQAVGVGTFTVDATGASTVTVPASAARRAFDLLAVTVEPEGGSPGPTTQPILAGAGRL